MKKGHLFNLHFLHKTICKTKTFSLHLTLLLSLSLSAQAQDYYWEKATGFPDQGAQLNVTDLQAADGVIRFNKQWYSYDDAIDFKRIESLINQDPAQPGNFYWTGPQGKWIFENKQNTATPDIYALDAATREVKTLCNNFNYGYYGSINKDNIVYFKNHYYTTGTVFVQRGPNWEETRAFRRYNPITCTWDALTLPAIPRVSYAMDKLVSDENNMYAIRTDINLGDVGCFVTQDGISWAEIEFPAPVLNNPWYYPKRNILADKRGFLMLAMSENDQVTNEYRTRFFVLKNQEFHPLEMGGDQPVERRWGNIKRFDSGNMYAVNLEKEVRRSKDNAHSWEKLSIINEPPAINDFIETTDGTFYIGTASGVYVLKKFKDPTPQGCFDLTFTKKTGDKTICKKGDVTFSIAGGKAPYTLRFGEQDHITSDSIHFSELENGYYEIDLEDANGCVITTDFYINHIIKKPLRIDMIDKSLCAEQFNISLVDGYSPYRITWRAGSEGDTTLYYQDPSKPNLFTTARYVLDKNIPYHFTISDQSGCPVVSTTQQGTDFKPEFIYDSAADCDSVIVKISIKNSTFNQFKLVIKDVNRTTLSTQYWTGSDFTTQILNNAYYTFEVIALPSQCSKQVSRWFHRTKLTSFNVKGEGCSGSPTGKGTVSLQMSNFQPSNFSMVWSDIGVLNTFTRTNLNAGIYTFEVKENQETGCVIKRTFEITKEPLPILPTIPFLCHGDTFNIVPATPDLINPTRFYLWNQDKLVKTIANGDTLTVRNEKDNAYRINSYNNTTKCFSYPVSLDVKGTESIPEIPEKFYTFCHIGDVVQLNTPSTHVHWYSSLNNVLLGKTQTLDYITLQAQDSIYLVLQNEEGFCRSDSITIYVQQSFIQTPTIRSTRLNATEEILKPSLPSDISTEYTYAWYGDDSFIKYGDSIIIGMDEWDEIKVVAIDSQECRSEKSSGYSPSLVLSNEASENLMSVSIHPNPSSGLVLVNLKEPYQKSTLSLKDLNGKTLWSKHNLEKQNELDLTALSPGVYILSISTALGVKAYKIVKQ